MSIFSLFDPSIDYSFALPKAQQCCLQEQSTLPQRSRSHRNSTWNDEKNTTLTTAARVTFAADPISEIISIPRYERESISELFYNSLDMAKFRHEVLLERLSIKVLW